MTGKRFIVKKIMFDGDCIVDTTDEGYYNTDKQDLENLCDVLNELHEENQLLKLQVETKLFSRREMLKENEQLKKENKRLQRCINEIYTIARLEE